MADETDNPGDDYTDDEHTAEAGGDESDQDAEAQRILSELVDTDDEDDSSSDDGDDEELREPGKRALERIKEQRNRLRTEADELRQKVKHYEDQGKSESQRLQEAAEEAKSRAATAEQNYLKMQAAFDAAPEGATLAQVRAVAKRVSGNNADELADDAAELFDLIGTHRPTDEPDTKGPSRKPRERLRGGGEPDDEPEEQRPNKLADLIGRH